MATKSAEVNHRCQVRKRTLPGNAPGFRIELMGKTFKEALSDALADPDISIRSVAIQSGVSYQKLKKLNLSYTESMKADEAIRIAAVFGKSVNAFVGEEDPGAALREEMCRRLGVATTSTNEEILAALDAQSSTQDDIEDKVERAVRKAIGQPQSTDTRIIERLERLHQLYVEISEEAAQKGEELSLEDAVRAVVARSDGIF